MTVQHLQETGVGRTVNGLRKYEGNVGDAAKALVFKWKIMVADEDTSDGDEEETCIPDVPEDHSDNHISSKLENTKENMSSLPDQSSESKHAYKHKETKSESFTKHNAHLSKSKLEEEKQERYEKDRHSSKHHSKSDKKSKESKSNDNSNNSKMEKAYNLTKYNHKTDDSKKINDKIIEVNKENNKKRKQDNSDSTKQEIKKRKLSDSKSDDEKSQLSISGKIDSDLKSCTIQMEKIKVREEIVDKDKQNKQESQEKSKSSSKSSLKRPSSKTKDSNQKQKRKREEYISPKKLDTKKESSQHSKKELSKASKASSSSNKNHDKNKEEKNQKKEDQHKDETKNRDKKKKETRIRLIQEMNGDKGIDCNSGMLNR